MTTKPKSFSRTYSEIFTKILTLAYPFQLQSNRA